MKYECVIQANLFNPKTLKPKRFMRRGETEKAAREAALVVSVMAGHQQRVDENIYTHESIEAMS